MKKLILFTSLLLSISTITLGQTIKFTDVAMRQDEFAIPGSGKTDFNIGQGIYAVATMEKEVANTTIDGANPSNSVNLGYFVKINGKAVVSNRVGRFAVAVPGAMFTRNIGGDEMYVNKQLYFVISATPDHPRLNVVEVSGPSKEFAKAIAEAGTGKHKVDVELRYEFNGQVSEPLSSGSFFINVDRAVKTVDLDGDMPAAKMNNSALSASMTTALRNGGWKYKVLKINIISASWKIHRNLDGKITHRTVDTYVGFKMDDGSCKAFNISFAQEYYGGKYNETKVNGTGDSFEVSCAKLGN